MGGGELFVVAPEFDDAGATRMSVHALDVYEARVEVSDLVSALEGCAHVIGTSARTGAYHQRAVDIRELCAQRASDALARVADAEAMPTAFVFGPEDSGLSNEDIRACHALGFIPTSEEYLSLNLAQAVVLTLYEFRRSLADCHDMRSSANVGHGDELRGQTDAIQIEAMFAQLEDALMEIGFLSPDNPEHIMATLRAMLSRAAIDPRELSVLRGVARQIRWFADGGREVAIEKRRRGDKLR